MMETLVSKYETQIDWKLIEAKKVTDYLPNWKQIVAKWLGIPIRYKYSYKVIASTTEITKLHLNKGYVVRFPINGTWRYFTCEGTANFSGFKWILKSVNLEHDIPNETYGENTTMQLIHRGTANYDG